MSQILITNIEIEKIISINIEAKVKRDNEHKFYWNKIYYTFFC